jgi:hypothetical protein
MLWIWMPALSLQSENVRDKAAKIQQYNLSVAEDNGIFALSPGNVKVLFDSGGKDSFRHHCLGLTSQELTLWFSIDTFDATKPCHCTQGCCLSAQWSASDAGIGCLAL